MSLLMCETKQRRLEAANASGIQAFLTGLLGKNAQTYFIQHVSQVKSHIFESVIVLRAAKSLCLSYSVVPFSCSLSFGI